MKMRPVDVLNNLRGWVLWPQSYHLSEAEAKVCIKALEQEPCDDEYIKVPKKALKYRTAGMVAYNAEWLKNHFDIERAVICGAQEPCEDAISRVKTVKFLANHSNDFEDVKMRMAFQAASSLVNNPHNLPPVNPEPKTGHWIPVSEKLPNDRDWYLGIFKESDTGWINPLPFICDYVGKKTKATTKEFWILRGFTDRDYKECDYYYNLECVAWMPLPEKYKAESEG